MRSTKPPPITLHRHTKAAISTLETRILQLTQSLQNLPPILTFKESARALSVSYFFLHRRKQELIDAGAIIQIDGAIRIEKQALIAWACAKTEKSQQHDD